MFRTSTLPLEQPRTGRRLDPKRASSRSRGGSVRSLRGTELNLENKNTKFALNRTRRVEVLPPFALNPPPPPRLSSSHQSWRRETWTLEALQQEGGGCFCLKIKTNTSKHMLEDFVCFNNSEPAGFSFCLDNSWILQNRKSQSEMLKSVAGGEGAGQ